MAYTAYYACMVHRFSNYITDARFLISALSAKPVSDGEEDETELTEEDKKCLSEKELRLKVALEKWVADREYCRDDVGTDDVVRSLGTSHSFFRYYFRNRMGTDFRAWRMGLRVAEAKRLIEKRPDISLDELCHLAGFNHLSNLHRQFEKIVGTTPADFKNNLN